MWSFFVAASTNDLVFFWEITLPREPISGAISFRETSDFKPLECHFLPGCGRDPQGPRIDLVLTRRGTQGGHAQLGAALSTTRIGAALGFDAISYPSLVFSKGEDFSFFSIFYEQRRFGRAARLRRRLTSRGRMEHIARSAIPPLNKNLDDRKREV
jgi:hypothetical protein